MVADTKPSPDMTVGELVPCVECDHDSSWHLASKLGHNWTDEEWEYEKSGTWNKGGCQWDDTPGTSLVNNPDPDDKNKCPCTAFKHPEAPRRREAIEHTRRLDSDA